MKKLIAVLMATATMWLSAAEVVELRNFNDGEVNAPRGGKLTRVEVFSTNATGSVTLKSVWAAPVFTNAVLIESVTATNVTVVSSNRTAALWRSITSCMFRALSSFSSQPSKRRLKLLCSVSLAASSAFSSA